MIADHQGGRVEVGVADEISDRVVIQVPGAGDVAGGEGLRVANVDDDRTFFLAKPKACSGGMRLNSLMGTTSFRCGR